jgi:glycosyltransferase involved in cell wall biosynthesis
MKLSVIIVARNEEHTIGTQLNALAQQEWTQPWEVIVADNGSTDGTAAVVQQYEGRVPHLRLLDASSRAGGPHARNVAAAAARGEYIAFCDADDEVAPDWVAAMGRAFAHHDFIASRFDHQKLNAASSQFYGLTTQANSLTRLWYPPHLYHASASGMGIKTATYRAVGGYDEDLLRLGDTDFCIRVQLAGTSLHFVPEAVIAYRHRTQNKAMFRQGRLWAQHNALLYQRYRPEGARIRFAWADYLVDWLHLVTLLPQAVRRSTRGQVIYKLGWQIGLLQGSLAYGVEPPVVPRTTWFTRLRSRLSALRRKLQQRQQHTT